MDEYKQFNIVLNRIKNNINRVKIPFFHEFQLHMNGDLYMYFRIEPQIDFVRSHIKKVEFSNKLERIKRDNSVLFQLKGKVTDV